MRQTEAFIPTLRRPPAEARADNAIWLTRAGYLRYRPDGLFTLLPLGSMVHENLTSRLRDVLRQHGALPWMQGDPAQLAAGDLHSWRQLPRLFWQEVQWQGEARPAAGLPGSALVNGLRLDALLAAEDETDIRPVYEALIAAATAEIDWLSAETAEGTGGFLSHPLGSHRLLHCPACGYTAEASAARRLTETPADEPAAPLEPVHTPGCHTIAEVCDYLDVPPERTAKAVFLTARIGGDEKLVFAVLRGDMTLDEAKLRRVLHADGLRPATADEIRAIGAEPGFASPVGLDVKAFIVVDALVPHCINLVAGANRPDWHLRNVNYGRDFQADLVADLAQIQDGDPCPHCGQPLTAQTAFPLFERSHPQPLTATYSAEDGQPRPIWHSSLTINTTHLLGALAEQHHDENGLIWPKPLAPYDIHLLWLAGRETDTRLTAERLYVELQAEGWRVLFDDREERPGVKFKDADLIGCPIRITVGERALQKGQVELKARNQTERQSLPLDQLIPTLRTMLS